MVHRLGAAPAASVGGDAFPPCVSSRSRFWRGPVITPLTSWALERESLYWTAMSSKETRVIDSTRQSPRGRTLT